VSYQRIGKSRRRVFYCQELLAAIGRWLPHRGLPLQVQDGRVRWTPRLLVTAAILFAWLPGMAAKDIFATARNAVVAMYSSRRRPGRGCQGFFEAMARISDSLLATVQAALRAGMEQLAGSSWRFLDWVVLGVDGTRVECPMTRANEQAFGCAGKKKTTPQLALTLLFHVATGLPWTWMRGGGKQSERKHLRKLIACLPRRTLLLADAGFTGYVLLRRLLCGGHDFIVRVGRNVTLLRKLGFDVEAKADNVVYLWPQSHRRCRPLMLRLVTIGRGRKQVCLLTSMLDESVLQDSQIARLYRLRWGIEVLYRSFKRTMEHHKMRSDSPAHALVELDWALIGLWMLGMMSLEATPPSRRAARRWSVAGTLRVVRQAVQQPCHQRHGGPLRKKLRAAVIDSYHRLRAKKARHWPHKKTEKPPGQPNIRTATRKEMQAAQAFEPLRATG
jgi:hypothetical protein